MNETNLLRAFTCARQMWLAANQPMNRATSPLRCRYVRLWNLLADRRRFACSVLEA